MSLAGSPVRYSRSNGPMTAVRCTLSPVCWRFGFKVRTYKPPGNVLDLNILPKAFREMSTG